MPRTPFNAAISGHRVYATSSLPLPDVRALAKSRGVTINDVVLALCAGALRRYLAEHAALPEKPLTAGVPVSMQAGRGCAAQQSGLFHPLPPADRRRRAAAAARRGEGRRPGGEEPVRRHARPGDDGHLDPRRPARRHGLTRLWAGARAANYLCAGFQYRHLERAGSEANHVLRWSAGHTLFSGFYFLTTAARSTSRFRAISVSSTSVLSRAARPFLTPNASPTSSLKTSLRCATPARGRADPGRSRRSRLRRARLLRLRAQADCARRGEGRTSGAEGQKDERAVGPDRRSRATRPRCCWAGSGNRAPPGQRRQPSRRRVRPCKSAPGRGQAPQNGRRPSKRRPGRSGPGRWKPARNRRRLKVRGKPAPRRRSKP